MARGRMSKTGRTDVAMGRNSGRYRGRLLHHRNGCRGWMGQLKSPPRGNMQMYSELERRYTVVPVAVETFGPINREGLAFLTETGRRLCITTGDARETSLLFKSLSVTIQRFNAVAFQGTMSKLSGSNERRSPSQDRFNDNVYDDS